MKDFKFYVVKKHSSKNGKEYDYYMLYADIGSILNLTFDEHVILDLLDWRKSELLSLKIDTPVAVANFSKLGDR